MDAVTRPKRKLAMKATTKPTTSAAPARAYPDLHDHVRALDKAGLLVTVDRPINKDTEMHPLVRWQFRGGIEEKDRKAFLFTNVVDSKRPQIRHPGAGRRARVQPRDLSHRHRLPVRRDRRALGQGGAQSDPAAHRRERAVPRDRHHRARRSTSPATASTAFRCRSRRRAGTSRPMRRCRNTSPRTPTPASRTWAITAAR